MRKKSMQEICTIRFTTPCIFYGYLKARMQDKLDILQKRVYARNLHYHVQHFVHLCMVFQEEEL